MNLPDSWPTKLMVVDFETYFDKEYNLKKMSIIEYITDKRFESICVGYMIATPDAITIPPSVYLDVDDWIRSYKQLYGKNFENVTIIVKNSKFDISILTERYDIFPPYVIDIEDLSRIWDAQMKHSLKKLAELFKLPPKGDTMQFEGLHAKDFTPEQQEAMIEYNKRDIEDEWQLFEILLPKKECYKSELELAKHTLDIYLKKEVRLNIPAAKKLMAKMEQERQDVTENLGYTIPELSGNISFLKILKAALPKGERVPMKQGKRGAIPAFAKTDQGMQNLLTHKDEIIRKLAHARQAVKSWPLHIKRVQKLINQAQCKDGRLGLPLKFNGGHTGRFSGTGGINPQNFGGKGRGKPIHPYIAAVRGLIEPPPGHKFCVSDSAQIEARVLAWLAGEDDLLTDFVLGKDIYSKFASVLFGHRIWKPKGNEPKFIKNKISIERGFGKDAILGCGYGMGALTFYRRCRENDNLRPFFDSGKFDFDFVKKLINTYRRTYFKIPKFWTDIEKAFRWVIKYPSEIVSISNDRITFYRQGTSVFMVLPSGREMQYRNVIVKIDKGLAYRWNKNIWGGFLTENVVQAISRDLLAHWILEIEKQYRVVLSSHDDVVSIVPDLAADVATKRVTHIMRTKPDWALGLPLDTETQIMERYGK